MQCTVFRDFKAKHNIRTIKSWNKIFFLQFIESLSLRFCALCRSSHPWGNFPSLMDNYLLPLMVNISVALCTYTAELFMYIVSMIGMEGEIQFVCFIVYKNKHINCFSLLIEGKDPVRCRYIYTFCSIFSSKMC